MKGKVMPILSGLRRATLIQAFSQLCGLRPLADRMKANIYAAASDIRSGREASAKIGLRLGEKNGKIKTKINNEVGRQGVALIRSHGILLFSLLILQAILVSCTNPATVFISGFIYHYDDKYKYAFVIPSVSPFQVTELKNIQEDGRFQFSINMNSVHEGEIIEFMKNNQKVNTYRIQKELESNGSDSYVLIDLGNNIQFSVKGTGPYSIENLILLDSIGMMEKRIKYEEKGEVLKPTRITIDSTR